MNPIAAHDFKLPITNEEYLKKFILLAFGVKVPDVQVCPNHSTPWRAFCDSYFCRSPVSVWKASRGFGGKSFLLALLGLTEAITLKADVNILGGSGEQANRVHEYMRRFWDYRGAPKNLLASDPSRRETSLTWGNSIRTLMASQASVRGPHPQKLRVDENDEVDIAILDAALGQPMGKSGIEAQTTLSSTHQYADGTMTEVLRRAREKGWAVHEWCWRESLEPHGWLLASEVERKRLEVTAAMWAVEYDLQEPSPESRAIQPQAVAAMFRKELGEYDGYDGEYIEAESPVVVCQKCSHEVEIDNAPEDGCCRECNGVMEAAKYATGADWARKRDWTVIVTARIDVTPKRIVAFERMNRRPWPAMIGRLDARLQRYPNSRAAHDATGLGDVVSGYLTSGAKGVVMVGRARSDMLTNYIGSVERGEYVSPLIRFMESEHRYASVDDVYGSGHLPDTIAATAILDSISARGVFLG